ncbi:MAG: LUD domain-containing protein [Alistipes putredinis]
MPCCRLDMIGNRIAPIAFGPRKVLLVVGRNKITPTREAAEERIRTIAAPQNIARHPGFRTPCAVTGVCADCYSEDRICNTHLRMERCFPRKRITVRVDRRRPRLVKAPEESETEDYDFLLTI